MGIESGTQLGIYKVVGPLGTGGMGEVYRATDTKLDREVALKVLPDSMAGDSERVARFQREAKLLASLNHPHIAAIYGFEEAAGKRFLVLELVEGPTLHDRLKSGPLMVEESLDIARQIAEALEAAHERGIVHRDLKPANIKLTTDGKVKVLDFGLAKALVDEDVTADPTSSPTITEHFTQPGVILGTAAYMSPEQARGRLVDKRTDIWAFGCVLYECLTGISIFAGETVTDSVGAVLHKQPEWDKLPPGTPPTVQLLLRRCLAKDRQRRLRDIGDVRIELEAAVADPTSSVLGLAADALAAHDKPSLWSLRGAAAMLAATFLGAVFMLGVAWSYWPPPPAPAEPPPPPLPVQRLAITLPQRESQNFPWLPNFDVSADGSLLAYTARGNEGKLYLRQMDQPTPTPLPGTEGGWLPVISPDGQWIAFIQDGKLKKISVRGGPPTTLCEVFVSGMSWTFQGDVIFCQYQSNGVYRVSENGGEPEQIITFDDEDAPFRAHSPHVLPDGSAVLISGYANRSGSGKASIKVHSFASGETKELLADATFPLYTQSGHLLFLRESTLMAAPFDAKRLALTGPAVPLVEEVSSAGTAGAHVRITAAGNLFFRSGGAGSELERRLVALDETGKITPLNQRTGNFQEVALSPDGRRVAITIWTVEEGVPQRPAIWTLDLTSDVLSILSTEPGEHYNPVWSPDGEWVYYETSQDNAEAAGLNIYRRRADRSGEAELVYSQPREGSLECVHPNGRQLLITEYSSEDNSPGSSRDIAIIEIGPEEEESQQSAWLATSFHEDSPAISPDGRWVAFISGETGESQVYVRPFEGPGASQQVSRETAFGPFWSHDGNTLYFLDERQDALMAAKVTSPASQESTNPPRLTIESREEVFDRPDGVWQISALPDGKGFFTAAPATSDGGTTEQDDPAVIHVMLGAHERLKQIAPVPEEARP